MTPLITMGRARLISHELERGIWKELSGTAGKCMHCNGDAFFHDPV